MCRSALKVSEVDLAAAKSHVDQFKEISQASEAALVALNPTFDECKAPSEASIVRHEVSLSFSKISSEKIWISCQSEIKSLQECLENGSKELAEIRAKFDEQQKAFEAERTAWIIDKKTLEDTNVDLSTSEKQTESDRNSREQQLSALEERAKVSYKVLYSF